MAHQEEALPKEEEEPQEEAPQAEEPQEEAPQAEEHQAEEPQEEAPQAEEHQEEEPLVEDPPEVDNHPHSRPKQHNQYKRDCDTNLYAAQKSKSSEETEQTPKNS